MSIHSELSETSSRAEMARFLRVLRTQLTRAIVPEMELTVRVAVMSAAGMSRPQMAAQLTASDIEIKAALERLKRIARDWKNEQ